MPSIGSRFNLGPARINRTNKEGTCLWCGRKLRRCGKEFGDYADNAFCGLRCGYRFGVAAAISGMRLVKYSGDSK